MVVCCADMEIEWSGIQQLSFIFKSLPIGVLFGVTLNIINGLGRIWRCRWKVFIADIVFSVIASVVTFFAALVITDGQLHPILFLGILLGLIITHFLCGKYIAKFVFHIGMRCSLWARTISDLARKFIVKVVSAIKKVRKTDNATAKTTKTGLFFKKRLEISNEIK